MSFVENALGEHERLVLKPRFPWLLRAASWTALVVLTLVPSVLWLLAALTGEGATGLGVLVVLSALVGVIVFGWIQLYMATTEVAVTSHRFIIKRGLIARFTNDLPLSAIENVDIHQGVLPRLFGYGHLQVQGSGTTGLRTPPMQDPVTFRTAISEARIALQDPPAFEVAPRRIDPMQRRDGPALDALGREAHLNGSGRKTAKRRGTRPGNAQTSPFRPRRLR